MRRLATITAKALTVLAGAAGFTLVSLAPNAQPAWAPQMVALELAEQRALGWNPCEPTVGQLPPDMQEKGFLADAIPTPYGAACAIRFSTDIDTDALHWVAWHEACHLSTMNEIAADPAHEQMEDAFHTHPLFLACLNQGPAERGGY